MGEASGEREVPEWFRIVFVTIFKVWGISDGWNGKVCQKTKSVKTHPEPTSQIPKTPKYHQKNHQNYKRKKVPKGAQKKAKIEVKTINVKRYQKALKKTKFYCSLTNKNQLKYVHSLITKYQLDCEITFENSYSIIPNVDFSICF